MKDRRSVSDSNFLFTKRKTTRRLSLNIDAFEKTVSETFLQKARALERVYADEEVPCVTNRELVLWVLFGVSGWWSANAIFAELPLFVSVLPAATKLGSQLSMMTQVGNVFLITYKVLERRYCLDVSKVIPFMMTIAFVSLVACALLWDVAVHGQSIPLLALTVITGGVGCMSNATYWAFMISYPALCTKAVSIGMNMGGVMTTALAALQLSGRGARPLFNARLFFLAAALLQFLLLWVVVMQQGGARTRRALAAGTRRLLESGGDEGTTAAKDPSHGGVAVPALTPYQKQTVVLLHVCSFLIHAATYAVPCLLPLIAGAYPAEHMEQELLVWMLFVQQGGGTLGRALAPQEAKGTLLQLVAAMSAVTVLAFFLAAAIWPHLLSRNISFAIASVLLPFLCLGFYFACGVLQVAVFLWGRAVVSNQTTAEHIASDMGFFGQMGALSANLVAFGALNLV